MGYLAYNHLLNNDLECSWSTQASVERGKSPEAQCIAKNRIKKKTIAHLTANTM